jgi:hypothetical protein
MPEFLSAVDVGHVHFNDWYFQYSKSVRDAVAVVRPGSGVDQHGIRSVPVGLMDPMCHLTLVIGLEAFHLEAEFRGESPDLIVDLGECHGPVLGRIAFSKHIQIDPMKNQYLFHGTSLAEFPDPHMEKGSLTPYSVRHHPCADARRLNDTFPMGRAPCFSVSYIHF